MNPFKTNRHIMNSPKKHSRNSSRALRYEHLEDRQMLAIDIVIETGRRSDLGSNQPALDAFNRAAAAWESHILDNITVTIEADLRDLGDPNIIGQTGTTLLVGGYDVIRDQLVLDAVGEAEEAFVAALPTGEQVAFEMPQDFGYDGRVLGAKASLKAAGFTGLDTQFGATDAEITFNSLFSFDFDRSNGISPGTMDFETVAIHEIGHALGFISEVDSVDYYLSIGQPVEISPSMLDLFRFEESVNPTSLTEFTGTARSLVPGVEAVTQLDIDIYASMSTGYFTGDKRQASHWKDGDILNEDPIGVLDPTLAYVQTIDISQYDLRALDLIGYDISLSGEPNSAPVAVDDTAKISKKSGEATGNVLDNDFDAEGNLLTAELVVNNLPSGGTVELNPNGSFIYTPGVDFTGTDSFTYVAVQSDGASSTPATVTITSGGGGGGTKGGGGGGRGGRNNNASPASALASSNTSFSLYISPIGLQHDMDVVEESIGTMPTTLELALNQVTTPRDNSSINESSSLNTRPEEFAIATESASWVFANESQLLELSVEILSEELIEDAGDSSALTVSEELQDLALAEWGLG